MAQKQNKVAPTISLVYAAVAGLWILLSDHVVALLFPDAASITNFQTYKGIAFVGLTALLLYLTLHKRMAKLEAETAEREQAEAALERNHEQYRRAIAAADAIPYHKVYGKTGYEFMGEGIKEVTGYGPDELSGAVWKELIQETNFYGEAAGMTLAEAAHRALAGEIKHWRADHRIRTRSGETRWIADSSIHIIGSDGKPTGSMGIIQDITERKRADAALRESESRFRQLSDSLPQLVWTCTPAGDCDYLSQQWIEYTGIPAGPQLGSGWLEQIHPDDRARVAESWQTAVANGTNFTTEYRIRRHDGIFRWFDDRAVALRDASGRIIKWFGSNTEIHEQRELRESLRANEEKLRTIFEAEPECLKLLELDGTVREINAAGLQILEADNLAALLGKNLVPCVVPEHQPAVLAMLEATVRGEKRTLEFQITGFKGTSRWLEMRTAPFREVASGRNLVLGVSRDITERRQTEQALRLSKERLRACIENTPNVAVQWYDDAGRVIFWNQASERLFGWKASAALGHTLDQLTQTPEQAAQFRETLQTLRQTGQIIGPLERTFRRRDGTTGISLSTVFAIPFDARSSCYVGMDVDISEIKQSRTEVEQSLSLLRATLEATADGILVVDAQGRITSYNRRFAEMWRLPEAILKAGDEAQAMQSAMQLLDDPETFRAGVQAVYDKPASASQDVLTFKDGRTFERYSHPQRVGDRIVGRVWNFREVTERRRVEKLVVQSEMRLRLVWENALLAMRLADANGNVVLVNNAYCKLTGKSRIELEGHPFTVAYAEQNHARIMAEFHERFRELRTETQRAGDVHFWNGKHAALEIADVFLDVAGQPRLLLTIINDITLRNQAEHRTAIFADMTRALSGVTSRKAAGEIIVQAAQKLIGWDACFFHRYDMARAQIEDIISYDTLAGKIVEVPIRTSFHQAPPFILEVLRTGPKLLLRSATEQGRTEMVPFGDTTRLSASLLYVPVREGGRPIGILSIQSYTPNAYDERHLATLQSLADHGAGALERLRAEEVLQQQEKQFRSLIENASDLITVITSDATIRFQSPSIERLLGYRPEDLIGSNAFDLIHPEDAARAREALQKILATPDTPNTFEGRLRHRDGTYRRIQVIGRSAPADSNPGAIILNSRDVTESRVLEEQFRQAQKMEAIGQLAGGVAHDFNNLLAVIQMQVELLKLEAGMSPDQLEATDEIGKAAQRAANLTRQLLMFSRRQALKPRDLDLNEIVGNVSKMLQRLLGEDVRMQVNYAPQPLFIHADQVMVDQILLNLAVNSRDAMPGGGRLIIETSRAEFDAVTAAQTALARAGTFACLSVSDTGKGIPPGILPHIFEPFFTTKDIGKGTGLGLATVFGIVQQHKGWISVQSEVNIGTTFRVFLPLLNEGRVEAVAEPTLATVPRGNETILLVEDEVALRALVRNVLTRVGYRVLEAPTGVAALELWKQHQADIRLLLTDMVMPDGVSGKELAQRLLLEQPQLKVIYTSGYSQEIGGSDFPLREGENFLAKPFQATKLAQIVRARLDS